MEEPGGTTKRLEDLAKEGDSPVDWFPTPWQGWVFMRRGDSLDRAPRAPCMQGALHTDEPYYLAGFDSSQLSKTRSV